MGGPTLGCVPMHPRDLVISESPNRIRDHLNRRARYNPTRSLTALTSQLTQEYEDRFLVELIQNAYDAHEPGTRDGRVHVRLDETHEEPVLYVANSGRPFAAANFDALTNVAQSSKPPGEGIGNKGVGFRSVLQVCESPEIFSCDPNAPDGTVFDGFCFGFATDSQIREMVASDGEYEVVKRDFSRYLLPVVAEPADPRLATLRSRGMVTVIRLPLTTERAVELARAQVTRLLEPTPPIALFLDRLASITVEHVGPDGRDAPAYVERRVEEINGREGAPALHWVETVGKRFLTTTRTLTAAEVRAVVGDAVALGELDKTWAEWDSDVEVSLAVPVSEEPAEEWPSTYTYLPMRVPSPVYAHLHAPFHTKLARLDLKEDSLFNSFLIKTAAELTAATIVLLASDADLELDSQHRRAAAVDLLCWDTRHIGHLEDALSGLGLHIGTSSVVPVQGPSGAAWAGLSESRVWRTAHLEFLTAEVIQAHTPVVDVSLGAERISRLNAVSRDTLSRDLEPSDVEVGNWVEKVARDLERASLVKWNRFLSDVARVFEGRQPTALRGRFILLDDKRKLRRSGPWNSADATTSEPTVFIPPLPAAPTDADDGEDLSSVPKNLKRAITFMHDGIRIRTRVGRTLQRTPIGELFKNADLVEPFELAAVLGHLERLLAGKVSNTTYRQALRWVYAQERASRANVADLARVGLHVPTPAGWIPATQAVFSSGWGTPRADAVAALVRESGAVSPSLQTLGTRVIADPAHWPFRVKDLEAFRGFLFRCGVRDGLFPVTLRSRTAIRMNGNSFTPTAIASRFELLDHELWDSHVKETWHGHLEGPYTPYTGLQHLWVAPGQDAFQELGPHAKDRLAAALLESLADWPRETESYVFDRRSPQHRTKPDPQRWPSPAKTFVERVAWFPMSDPGRRDERYFVPVPEGWTFDETANEVAPRFARLAPMEHRRRLTASASARTRLEEAGLNTWNSAASAEPRLIELAELVASGEVAAAELPSIRRAASRAWSELTDLPRTDLALDIPLIVSRGQVLGVIEPDANDPMEIFVQDVSPGLVTQVLEAGDFPVLVADPADGPQVIGLLENAPGYRVRGTSAVDAKVVLDGQELDAGDATGDPLLTQFGSWLVRTLLAIVDLRSSRFVRVTNKVLHDAEARLRRMRIAVGSSIALVVDGRSLPAAGRLAESVHLNDPSDPLLVLNGTDVPVPSWQALEILADDLSELMGQAQAASEIRAAALALQRSVEEWREPSDAELARALRCSVESVVEVLQNLRTSTDHLRILIAPFVGVIGGVDSARTIESEQVDDASQLKALVAEMVGEAHADAIFLAADRAESISDMRLALGTDLGDLNTVLVGLGRDPLAFPELHSAAMSSYLDEHRVELLDDLRQRFISQSDERGDLTNYTRSREFADLLPDPRWLFDHEVPTESKLAERASAWLAARGDVPGAPRILDPIDDVRAANQAVLSRELPVVADVVRAWVTKQGEELPDVWADLQQIRDQLGASGALDFVVLAVSDLLSWIDPLGMWPADMPLTLDTAALGLSAPDIAAGKASGSESEGRRRRRRTELPFGDRTYDTASEELHDFADAINASVTNDFLLIRPAVAKLADIPPRKPGGASKAPGGGPPRPGRGGKPTDEVTAAVGLAGEILAYRWLQAAYAETTPDSWVSRNRRFHLGGHPGDDTLGYDFRVARKNETLFFEVKATKTDEYEFDIGESELRAARSTRKGWYRIIFIRSVLTADDRELLVLPHPLDPCYAQVNQGLRLRFDPITGIRS
jgi:hypothetical protein